jgi:putative transposase
LKEVWTDEHARWLERDLSAKHYVYLWVDGIHLQARLEDEAQCILVIIGATADGKKELVGLADGALAPKLVVADGALGFWKAVGEVWSKVREQRCWVHKTANVLNKLPRRFSRRPRQPCRTSGWPRRWREVVAAA